MDAGFAGSAGECDAAVAWLSGGRRWLLLVVCLGLALLAAQMGAPAALAAPTVYPSYGSVLSNQPGLAVCCEHTSMASSRVRLRFI